MPTRRLSPGHYPDLPKPRSLGLGGEIEVGPCCLPQLLCGLRQVTVSLSLKFLICRVGLISLQPPGCKLGEFNSMRSLKHAKHLLRPAPGTQQELNHPQACGKRDTIIFIVTVTAPWTTSQVGWGLPLLGASPSWAISGRLCWMTFLCFLAGRVGTAATRAGATSLPSSAPALCPCSLPRVYFQQPGCPRPAPGVGGESEPG